MWLGLCVRLALQMGWQELSGVSIIISPDWLLSRSRP